jgi:TolA-binding protein
MRNILPSVVALALLAGLMRTPAPAFADSKELVAIQQIQREFYDLNRKLDELKSGQTEGSGKVATLLEQMAATQQKLAGDVAALQDGMRRSQSEQQTKLIEPVSGMKLGIDDISGSVAGIQSSMTTLRTRQESVEKILNDLRGELGLIRSKLEQPVAISAVAPITVAPPATDSAALLFAAAQRDRLAGKVDAANAQFFEISQKYPESPEAPMAVFEMGALYAENDEYEQALKAFDRVLEQFGDNPMRKNAHYMKAVQLERLGRKPDAAREYESFARAYPGDVNGPRAAAKVRELRTPEPAKPKSAPKRR